MCSQTRETRWIPSTHKFLIASTQEEENSFVFTIERVNNSLVWRAYNAVQLHARIHLNCVGAHLGR